MEKNAKRIMSGTFGQLWADDVLLFEVNAFQAKQTYQKEERQFAGEMAVDSKVTSVKGTGSFTSLKVCSRLADHGDSITRGIDRRYKFIGKLDDPDAFGAERVALYNVSLDEETIMDWKVGSIVDITTPFTFTRREWLDTAVAL